MSGQKIETFDVSPKVREILEFKHAKRTQLRQEYLREMLNPMRQGVPIDSAIERFSQMRLRHEYVTKVKGRATLVISIALFGSMYLAARSLEAAKGNQEKKIRAGYRKYADVEFKFS